MFPRAIAIARVARGLRLPAESPSSIRVSRSILPRARIQLVSIRSLRPRAAAVSFPSRRLFYFALNSPLHRQLRFSQLSFTARSRKFSVISGAPLSRSAPRARLGLSRRVGSLDGISSSLGVALGNFMRLH